MRLPSWIADLFRRANGVNVLVATSTLAQGMNLLSEVVIIAGGQPI
jgi:replicative superfamily II helicase